jgi:aldehyde:ferredoxin oxidoreductase
MAGGYAGKLLWVNLSTGELRDEIPDESLNRDFIGGYGLGARLLYSSQKAGVDPLGPENTLGILTGPLTGTPAMTGCRFVAVGKSPLTGGWGEANCGGDFGPNLKFAGYDGVFFTGISPKPVYLFIDNGNPELRDASHLWGKTTFEVDDILHAEHGKAKVISIGPAGEKLSLVSGLMTNGGTAARSGLGAVMGSKKVKAVVEQGDRKVPMADAEAADNLRKEQMIDLKEPFARRFHKYGTGGHADTSALSGDSPVKNWAGVGVIDLPDVSGLKGDVVIANVIRRTGCWRCPIACRGRLKESTGEYPYPENTRRPEYETLAAFGAMVLNSDAEVVAHANYLCDAYGLDTISTGTIIGFAMECYERGILTKADTDGIDLTWGNKSAIIAIVNKMGAREGIGDILADGVKVAAERIGKGSEEYAVHIGGQELGLHDPKFLFPPFAGIPVAARYQMDAAPGRHTTGFGPSQFPGYVLNAAGLCMHFNMAVGDGFDFMVRFLKAVTGLDRSPDDILKTGERIANIRHAFTLREGINPLKLKVHGRIIGRPPQTEGPLAGVSANLEEEVYWNLGALDWDPKTTRPSQKKLLELGLNDVAEELYPPKKTVV